MNGWGLNSLRAQIFSWHRSSAVVALLMLAFLIPIVVPGYARSIMSGRTGIGVRAVYDHGWPYTFLSRSRFFDERLLGVPKQPDPLLGGVPWLAMDRWRLWQSSDWEIAPGENDWSFAALALDIIAAVTVTGVVAGCWEWRRRRRPGVLSVSLLELLVLMTVVGCALGMNVRAHKSRQRAFEIASELEQQGLAYLEDRCIAPSFLVRLMGRKNVPAWCNRYGWLSLGYALDPDDCDKLMRLVEQLGTITVVEVDIVDGEDRTPFPLGRFSEISSLRTIVLNSFERIGENQLAGLGELTQLGTIFIPYDTPSEATLEELQLQLPQCRFVFDEPPDFDRYFSSSNSGTSLFYAPITK